MNYQKDLEKVKSLQVGQECTVFWFDGGGGIVRCPSPSLYELYEVPQYGGEERYHGLYIVGEEMTLLDIAYTWT